MYPVVCWLYSCAKVLQCKYNAQDVDCDFLCSSACTVNLGPHILVWCVCPFCWLRLSYIAKSRGSISEHIQKHEKWFTVFWPTIRFIWFDCCYNMLDFQKCGVLCNQWKVPLQMCARNWCFSSIICTDTSPEKQTCKAYIFKNLSQGFSSFKLNFLLHICSSEQYFLWKHQTLAQPSLVHGLYMPCTFFILLMSALVSMAPTSLKTKLKRYLYTVL